MIKKITRQFSDISFRFKTLDADYFTQYNAKIDSDKSTGKKDSIQKLLPEIRSKIHVVSERNIYRMLLPIANTGSNDHILEQLIMKEMIEPMRTNGFSTELFESSKYPYIRFFNTFGRGFYFLKKDAEKREITHEKSPFISIDFFTNALLEDIDKITAANEKSPDKVVLALHTLILNHERLDLNQVVMQKLVREFLTNSSTLDTQLNSKNYSISKCLNLAKVSRFLQLSKNNQSDSVLFSKLLELEDKALSIASKAEQNQRLIDLKTHPYHFMVGDILKNICKPLNLTVKTEVMLEQMFRVDFFVPELNLCIEINNNNSFYPSSRMVTQFNWLKTKMLKQNGQIKRSDRELKSYRVITLSSFSLQAHQHTPEKISSLLKNRIEEYIASESHQEKQESQN